MVQGTVQDPIRALRRTLQNNRAVLPMKWSCTFLHSPVSSFKDGLNYSFPWALKNTASKFDSEQIFLKFSIFTQIFQLK